MCKILVVDDDKDMLDNMVAAVRDAIKVIVPDKEKKYEIACAKSVEDAKRIIDGISRIDLVVCDLILYKDENAGFEILEYAKKKDAATQVIIITSYHSLERGIRAMLLGAFDYVPRGAPQVYEYTWLIHKIPLAIAVCDSYREKNR